VCTHASGAGAIARSSSPMRSSSYISLLMTGERSVLFHQQVTKFSKAPGDAAGDGAGGQSQRRPDRGVALVAPEEPVEDVPARLAHRLQRLLHAERLVQLVERVVDSRVRRVGIDRLASACADAVDAEPPRQLRDPRPDGIVAAQVAETLV